MRALLLPLALLIVLGLCPYRTAGQSCAGITVRAKVSRRALVRGKTFHLVVAVDERPKAKKFASGLALQVTLPQGIYFLEPSKSLLAEPSFWSTHDSALQWLIGDTPTRKLRVNLAAACTEGNAPARQLSFGVSIIQTNGQGGLTCAKNTTATVGMD